MWRNISKMEDELLDLVNEEDHVIDKKPRSEVYQKKLLNFRVVNAFVMNRKGQLWIPRRSANKRIFPLCLDMSMGGHVQSGETYDRAFQRELQEELHLDTHKIHWNSLGYLTPHQNNMSAFMKVFMIYQDQIDRDPQEFVESFWLFPREVLQKLKEGDTSKEDLPKLINYFFK